MGKTTVSGNQNAGKQGFIEACLESTMEPIVGCFLAIPEAQRYTRALGTLSAPCCVFAHIALAEERMLKGFTCGIAESRCPFPRDLFNLSQPPTEEQLRQAVPDTSKLVDFWRDVRKDTLEFLKGLTPEDLAKGAERSILPDGHPRRDNPIRDYFMMAINHQVGHWGVLRAISTVLGVTPRR